MQNLLPFFPKDTKHINACVSFCELDGIVYYLVNGSAAHCHGTEDRDAYRFTLASLVKNKACTIKELANALGVPRKNIERYTKAFREHGAGYFFGRTDGRGQCHKMTPEKIKAIQSDLDNGLSVYRAAANHSVSEAAINYHIKKGNLKKKVKTIYINDDTSVTLSTPSQRSQLYLQSADGLGMATTRAEERILCALGLSGTAPAVFESCQTIPFGGAMLLLPFLLECGLLSYRNYYSQRQKGYYDFDSLLIIIAYLYLCRIKSFEQTKLYSSGEFGKLVGRDRIPEVKKLRGMFGEITSQKCANKWIASLSQTWIAQEEPELYYVDGHVQVYHGNLANLGKKYVSRQRLCLPGVMEFWVNASDGNPYFYVTADVNEKMGEMLTDEIIPRLLELHPVSDDHKKRMEEDKDEPLFTLVFDREPYSPELFATLWTKHRIAIITYKKNVKDKWDEGLFKDYSVPTTLEEEKMLLHEKTYCTADKKHTMREVRRLCPNGHQTSVVSTNKKLTVLQLASCMFARWAQENFFGYMRQNYAFDKIVQYSVDELDIDIKVVNPAYSKLDSQVKKEREKLCRRQSKLYEHDQKNPLTEDSEKENEKDNEKAKKKWMKERLEIDADVKCIKDKVDSLVEERSKIPYKISVGKMPENKRYNILDLESKMVQNIIKIICYRAETALARLLCPHYKRAEHEIRMLIKAIINTPIDMQVDNENNELKITLYPLANQRSNEAVSKICETVNNTNTIFPGTNLRLIYKIATV